MSDAKLSTELGLSVRGLSPAAWASFPHWGSGRVCGDLGFRTAKSSLRRRRREPAAEEWEVPMPGSSRCLSPPGVPDPQEDAGQIEETFTFCGSQKTENGCLKTEISLNQHSKPRFLLIGFPKKIGCHIESHMDCCCSFLLSKYIQNPALSFHLYCYHLGQVPIISCLDCPAKPLTGPCALVNQIGSFLCSKPFSGAPFPG